MNSIQFAKTAVTFADDLLKLFTTEQEDFIADVITAVYKAQISHIEDSLKSGTFKKEESLIIKNAQFLLEVVIGKTESLYTSRNIPFPTKLQQVNAHFRKLKATVNK